MYSAKSYIKGELALTISILSFIIIALGTISGAVVQQQLSTSSSAGYPTRGGCWASCPEGNRNCYRSVDPETGKSPCVGNDCINLACDMRIHQCVPANGEKTQCPGSSQGGNQGGKGCGETCANSSQCNRQEIVTNPRTGRQVTIGLQCIRRTCVADVNSGTLCPQEYALTGTQVPTNPDSIPRTTDRIGFPSPSLSSPSGGPCSFYADSKVIFKGQNASSRKQDFSTYSTIHTIPPVTSNGSFSTLESVNPANTEAIFINRWDTPNMENGGKTASVYLSAMPRDVSITGVFCNPPTSNTCKNAVWSSDKRTISNMVLTCGDRISYGWDIVDAAGVSPGQGTISPTISGQCAYHAESVIEYTGDNASQKNTSFSTFSTIYTQPIQTSNGQFRTSASSTGYDRPEAATFINEWDTSNMQHSGKTASVYLNSIEPGSIITDTFCTPASSDACKNARWSSDKRTISNMVLTCGERIRYGWDIQDGNLPTPTGGGSPGQGQPPIGTTTPIPTVSGYIPPSGFPEGDQACRSGYQYSSKALSCGASFRVCVDPVISGITLVHHASGQRFSLGEADSTGGSSSGWTSPIGYRTWAPRQGDSRDNVTIEWDPRKSYPGVQNPAVHIHLYSGGNPDANYQTDEELDFYYFNNIPSWVFSGDKVTVEFKYYVTYRYGTRQEKREDFMQQVIAEQCNGVTPPTGTVVTPPTGTPTPTVTHTPTATVVTPPTSTPPPPCSKSIYFMIDNSSTQADKIDNIETKLNDYFDQYPQDNITITYNTFSRDVEPSSGTYTYARSSGFIVPQSRWTNIRAAHDRMQQVAKADLNVIVTDGIPTVLSAQSPPPQYCAYQHLGSATTILGCDPVSGVHSYKDTTSCRRDYPNFDSNCPTNYPVDTITAVADVVVESTGAEGLNLDVLRRLRKTDGTQVGIDSFIDTIDERLDRLCGRDQQQQQEQPIAGFGMSYMLINQSSENEVESMSLSLCEGGNCQNKEFNQSAGMGERVTGESFFQSTDDLQIYASKTYTVNCNVVYSDGSTKTCESTTATGDEGARLKLLAGTKQVNTIAQTMQEASDFNEDGCTNSLDYGELFKRMAQEGTDQQYTDSRYDLTYGESVNSQDASMFMNYVGTCHRQQTLFEKVNTRVQNSIQSFIAIFNK